MNTLRKLRHSIADMIYPRLPRYRDLEKRALPVDYVTHPLRLHPPATFWHLIHHYSPSDFPTAPFVASRHERSLNDHSIAERLHNYFLYCSTLTPDTQWLSKGMWDELLERQFPHLVEVLKRGDLGAIHDRLSAAGQTEETDGMGLGSIIFRHTSTPTIANAINAMTVDRLAACATALGAIAVENPEQGRYGENIHIPLADFVEMIERQVGFPILRKPIMGLFGITYEGGIIDPRTPEDIYATARLHQIAESVDTPIAEIGGGFGGCAEFAIRSGFTNYTIYDLPLVGLLQAFYLCHTLPPEDVWLEGETPSNSTKVHIRPFFSFDASKHDLFLNRDSLPEMPARTAQLYLDKISAQPARKQLLSINQEGEAYALSTGNRQIKTATLAGRATGLKRKSRHPYWLRKGYVEEHYQSLGRRSATASPSPA